MEQVVRRHDAIMTCIRQEASRTGQQQAEAQLAEQLMASIHRGDPDVSALHIFDFVWEYEYTPVPGRPDLGKGDLVLTDPLRQRFAVVELKHLNYDRTGNTGRRRRNGHLNKVKSQALEYARHFAINNPEAPPPLAVYVLGWREYGRWRLECHCAIESEAGSQDEEEDNDVENEYLNHDEDDGSLTDQEDEEDEAEDAVQYPAAVQQVRVDDRTDVADALAVGVAVIALGAVAAVGMGFLQRNRDRR
jgi:hypothetical protein